MRPLLSKEEIVSIIGQEAYDRQFNRGHGILMGKIAPEREIDVNQLVKKAEAEVGELLMNFGAAVLVGDTEEQKNLKFRMCLKWAFLAGLHQASSRGIHLIKRLRFQKKYELLSPTGKWPAIHTGRPTLRPGNRSSG